MKRKLAVRILTLVSLLGIAALCVILYALAGTTRGSHWLIQYIDGLSDTWGLSAGKISGSLLHGLTLEKFSFTASPNVSVYVDTLLLEWHPQNLLKGEINISPFKAEGIEIGVTPSDESQENAPAAYSSYNLRLPLTIAIEEGLLENISLTTPDAKHILPNFSLKEGSLGSELKVQQFTVSNTAYSLTVQNGEVASASPFKSNLEIIWHLTQDDKTTINGHGRLHGNLETLTIEHVLTSPITMESSGNFHPGLLTGQPPHLELINKITDSRWSYGRNATVQIPYATVTVQGWTEDYALHVNGLFNTADLPKMSVELTGKGNLSNLQIDNMTIQGLDGRLETAGTFTWKPSLSWDLQLKAGDIDPGKHWKQWPGTLAMLGAVKGEYTADVLETNLQIDSLTGTLRNYPLQASGNVRFNNGQWSSQDLRLSLGKNNIQLSGSIGDTITTRWNARLPNLAALWPGLNGRLAGKGAIEGEPSRIHLTGELRAENLEYQNYSAGFVNFNANTARHPQDSSFQHSVNVQAGNLNINGFIITDLQSKLNGSLDNHKLQTSLVTQHGALNLEISGQWQSPQWQATLHQATIRDTAAGTWRLETPSSLQFSPDIRALTETCWRLNQAEACFSGRVTGSEINAAGNLSKLPLQLAKPWLPANLEVQGRLNGRLQVAGTLAEPMGTLILQPEDGYFLVKYVEGEPESYPWRDARMRIGFNDGAYDFTAGILLPDQGSASASIKLSPEKQLGGNIMLNFSQLAWLEAWIPSLRDIQGEFYSELNLSGTVEQPQWRGSAHLDQASATAPILGIELKKITLSLEADTGNQVSIEGSARSGPGRILLDGRINQTAAQLWQLSLGIKGERFEVVNTPEAHILATPELNVNASRKLVNIEGAIQLPEVDIRLQNLPVRTVKVSDDAVIVNEPETELASTNGIPVKTNIKLILGEKVHFNGFGFEAKLSGSLDLVEEPGQPTLAYGELTIDEGRYKAYGQNLSVEQGRLIFQGPYDNPGLDIRAVRKTSDVTVGLNIGGTLKDIRSTVFSEPSLPDSDAVAILLTGKPLSDTDKNEANILVNAIASLGIKKSRTLTSQLSETLGLDVLTIESDSGLQQSSLTIGKYLTPRLYVRYAIGLFDQLSKLALEYRLTEHLMVEAKSGKDQSMDIIYRIER